MPLQSVGFFALGELAIVFVMALLIWSLGIPNSQESKLVHFAAVILTTLALIFLLSMAMYYWEPSLPNLNPSDGRGAKIFDRCAQIIPPIVTLVIGYFFGRQEK